MSEIVDNSFSDLSRQRKGESEKQKKKKSNGIIRELVEDEFPDNEYSPSSKHGVLSSILSFYSVFLLEKTHSINPLIDLSH